MAESQDIVACDICKQEPLQHYCNGCEIRLCNKCVVNHLDSGSVEGHTIVLYKYRDARNIQPRVCLNHCTVTKTLYCRGCFEQICVRCIDEHRGHDLTDLKQFVNSQYKEIEKTSEYLRIKLLPKCKNSIENLKLVLEEANTKFDQERQRILDARKDLRRKVDEEVDVLLGEIDKQKKETLHKLQDMIRSTEARLQDTDHTIDMCEAAKSSLEDVLKFNFDESSLDIAPTVDVTFPHYRAPSKYTVDVGSLRSIREEKRILDEPYGKNNQSLEGRKPGEDNPRMKSIACLMPPTPTKNKPTVSGKDYIKLVLQEFEDESNYSEAVKDNDDLLSTKECDDLLSTKVYGISNHGPVVPFKEENVTNEQIKYKPNLAEILLLACKDKVKNYSLAWREYIDLIEKHKAAVCQQRMSFSPPVLVAAIDLGTTVSGYAFSFRHEFDQDPLKINICDWIAGNQVLVARKTPSVVLLKPDKTFHSFGYEAENKYASLAVENEHEGWLYFKLFKMALHKSKSLRRTTTIKDINGKEMPAMTVFTMAIRYLKEHLMKTLTTRVDTVTEDLIRWVLTVPAIWDEGAKQFMMEAAKEAGIDRKQLILALEPEAASIYCNHVPTGLTSVNKRKTESYKFNPGTRYMVIDLGGETTNITVHEVQSNQTLRKVHHATGGAWGGTKVEDAFYQFLVKLFGDDILTTFKTDNMDDYISLFRDFETKKYRFKPDLEDKVTISLPSRLLDIFEEETDETLAEALPQTSYAKKITFMNGKLRVHHEIFKDFFRDTLQEITQHITEIMSSIRGDSVSKILLVGGFSESPMVLRAIKDLFPDKEVIAPAYPGLAVLKGAVLFGHMPSYISRISPYSIGFEVNVPFIEGLHRKEYKIKRPSDGHTMCQHIFEALLKKGEEVPIGHKIENTYTPREEDAVTGIGIYQSTSKNPTYTTEKNCTKIGTIKLRRPHGGWSEDSLIHAVVEFGGTHFDVALTDDCLHETYRHSYDFLGN